MTDSIKTTFINVGSTVTVEVKDQLITLIRGDTLELSSNVYSLVQLARTVNHLLLTYPDVVPTDSPRARRYATTVRLQAAQETQDAEAQDRAAIEWLDANSVPDYVLQYLVER